MFIQSRCLYIVGDERRNSKIIYSNLESLGLIDKLFNDSNLDLIMEFLELLPDQTIFSKQVSRLLDEHNEYFISLPFFSSHLKMPVKCGEYIWVYPYISGEEIYEGFSINSYWFSRVHGLDHSEDVNFTFNDRDFDIKNSIKNIGLFFEDLSVKKSRKKRELRKYKKFQLENVIKPEIGFGNLTFELDIKEKEYLENNLSSYTNRCIPKINKQPEDLLLQGSNNTFIKMTSDGSNQGSYDRNTSGRGEVSIVSGSGSINKKYSNIKYGNFIDNNGSIISDSRYTLSVSNNSNSASKLYHEKERFSENIKNINLYSMENIENISYNEGAFLYLEDASKIIVSENSNHEFLLNKKFDYELNIGKFSYEKFENNFNSNLLEENKSFTLLNFKNNFDETFSNNIPCVSLITNSINAFSREGSGNISLIKEYYSEDIGKNLNAAITINSKGDILIDGSRIFIGSESLEKEKGNFENGQGTIVNIGLGEESQSLVLGEQLKEYMQEMISINIEDMDLTKKLFEHVRDTQADMDLNTFSEIELALNNTINNIAQGFVLIPPKAGPASAAIPDILSIINNFAVDLLEAINNANRSNTELLQKLTDEIVLAKLKKEEELSNRIKTISDNIDKILSKISKTS